MESKMDFLGMLAIPIFFGGCLLGTFIMISDDKFVLLGALVILSSFLYFFAVGFGYLFIGIHGNWEEIKEFSGDVKRNIIEVLTWNRRAYFYLQLCFFSTIAILIVPFVSRYLNLYNSDEIAYYLKIIDFILFFTIMFSILNVLMFLLNGSSNLQPKIISNLESSRNTYINNIIKILNKILIDLL